MTVRYSTGVASSLLTKMDQDFTNYVIDFYSGNQPLTADEPPSGLWLARATLNGDPFNEGVAANGLNFADPVSGIISKEAAEDWKYTGLAVGTIRWFRLRANGVDDGSASTTLLRIDGSAGTLSGDMLISNINMVVGTPGTIDVFNIKKRDAA